MFVYALHRLEGSYKIERYTIENESEYKHLKETEAQKFNIVRWIDKFDTKFCATNY
jgi:hypothetical protein